MRYALGDIGRSQTRGFKYTGCSAVYPATKQNTTLIHSIPCGTEPAISSFSISSNWSSPRGLPSFGPNSSIHTPNRSHLSSQPTTNGQRPATHYHDDDDHPRRPPASRAHLPCLEAARLSTHAFQLPKHRPSAPATRAPFICSPFTPLSLPFAPPPRDSCLPAAVLPASSAAAIRHRQTARPRNHSKSLAVPV